MAKVELRLYVLNALVQYGSQSSFQHLSGSEVQHVFREIGFSDDAALNVLTDLYRMRFLHTSSHSQATLEASYIPTRLGGYVVRNLISNFTFVENTMMDTFIADQEVWNTLRSVSDSIYSQRDTVARIHHRVERVSAFYNYMKERFSALNNDSVRRGLAREWCSHPLVASESQFLINLRQVESSVQKNYGPKS